MERSKKLCILSAVLVVACLAALVALHTEEKKESIKTGGETVLDIEPAKVTSLAWETEDNSFAFHRDGDWVYDADEAFPVSETAMDELLGEFQSFGAAFVIEEVTDYSAYGLEDPVCTITLTTEDKTYTIRLGDYSTMDSRRYVDAGDGNVYLAVNDPMDVYDVELKDLIANDETPYFDTVSQLRFSGAADYTVNYTEDGGSICADDTYFTTDGRPLDTGRVNAYLSDLRYLGLTDYVTYKVTEAELADYGLDDPELTLSIDYDDDGTADTFVLHVSRDPKELAAENGETEEDETVTAYARVGNSAIIYQLSESDYRALMAAGYDDLRHQELFTGDFDEVTSMDITLDGETVTLTSDMDGKERVWSHDGAEIDMEELQDALEALTAEEFTSERATGQKEIGVTLHLDRQDFPEVSIALYRYDGTNCLAAVDGTPTALIPRSEAVTLMEAVRAITLN